MTQSPSPSVDEVAVTYPDDVKAAAQQAAIEIGLKAVGYDGMWLEYDATEEIIAAVVMADRERRASLVSPPKAGEGEPVAWRWKAHGHEAGPWIVVHDKGTAEAAMSLFASKGKHQSVQPLYATQQPRVDGVRVTELAQALRNALPEYESWMDGHSDATKSSTCRQLTFGEIRAAYALLAALSLEQGETAP